MADASTSTVISPEEVKVTTAEPTLESVPLSPRKVPLGGTISLTEVLEKVKDLDLVFFNTDDPLSAFAATKEEDSEFTHVGIVISSESMPFISNLKSGKKYIWESTSPFQEEDKDDVDGGLVGVQIRLLEDVLKASPSGNPTVAWAPLKNNPWLNWQNHHGIRNGLKHIHMGFGHENVNVSCWNKCFKCLPLCLPFRTLLDTVEVAGQLVFRSPKAKAVLDIIRKVDDLAEAVEEKAEEVKEQIKAEFSSDIVVLILQELSLLPDTDDKPINTLDLINGNKGLCFDPVIAQRPLYIVQ